MATRIDAALKVLAREVTPESEALEYRNPAVIRQLEAIQAELDSTDPEDAEALAGIGERVEALQEALKVPVVRVRFRQPTTLEAHQLAKASALAARDVRGPENRAEVDSYVTKLDDQEAVETILELLGKGTRWVEAGELLTPQALLQLAAQDVRKRLERAKGVMQDDTAANLDAAIKALEAEAETLDSGDFALAMQTHLTQQDIYEVQTDDQPRESMEAMVLRHLRAEANRRVEEHQSALAEWTAKPREELDAALTREIIKQQQASKESERYMLERLAACTLMEADGKWVRMFDDVQDILSMQERREPQEGEDEADVDRELAASQDFLQWLVTCLQQVTNAEANMTQVVASRQFRSHVGSL